MMPIIPHLSNECYKNIDQTSVINWPTYDEAQTKDDFKTIVIQINGKKRSLINASLDLSENDLMRIVNYDQQIMKYLQSKEIKKKIYIKNKLLNIIV